ncbi:MAG TPA: hypothetical protein DF480_02050 [Clostridiales bacterium]|nr:hypothetical protein [Clostridiales bacterium]
MNSAMRKAVLQGIHFIEANLHERIGVSDVAAAVSYSPFYFSRAFSAHAHISVYDYILRRKISEAYKELFSDRPRIVDLAFRYGFQSHEVFTRTFRKAFGEAPSEAEEYKPLALFEPIDEDYLTALSRFQVRETDKPVGSCYFELSGISSGEEPKASGSLLLLLSRENLYRCECVLEGQLALTEAQYLFCGTGPLRQKLQIRHADTKHALRYFTDHYYAGETMKRNYIVANRTGDTVDIYVPE